ncbi:MAG: hypothetical protein JWR07_1947 [Nevskia sp.]|nr:hypothetical protein [Nevskia sp.]
MRWDLRPNDWYLIWPELIGVEGAPSVPAIVAGEKPAVLPASAPKAKKPRETEKPVASGEERRVKTTRRLEQRRVNGERRDGNDPRTTGLKKPRGA